MDSTIPEAFESQVRRTPDSTAVCDAYRCLTYAELDALSDNIASRLPKNPRFVGLVMDHGIEMVAAILAIMKAGAAYVPAEPSFPRERIRFMMDQSQVSCIVTQRHYESLLAQYEVVLVDQITSPLSPAPQVAQTSGKAEPESPAYVLYTSGTTGVPKGVVIEQRNICHYVKAFCEEFALKTDDVMLQNSVCTFDIFVEEVFPILLSGGTLAIPDAVTRNDLASLIRFIEERGVTIMSGFPYLLLELNKLTSLPRSLRLLISGGDILREKYVSTLLDQVEIYNTYGPSEATVCATYYRCNDTEPLADGTYPVGKEVPGVQIVLVDGNGVPVSAEEEGEICILGDGVGRGYLDSTLEKGVFGVTDEGVRYYRSGDMARRLKDGNLAFLERKDQQVMIMGKRVEPQEVENVLGRYDGIEHGVVVPECDEDGLAYLSAYIVPEADPPAVAKLRAYLRDYLPEYMIPEYFVVLDELPMTDSGKVDRHALPIVLKAGGL